MNAEQMSFFAEAESQNMEPTRVDEEIAIAMRDPFLAEQVLPYLRGDGRGSATMDHGVICHLILDWDKHHGGRISRFGLSNVQLWQHVVRVMRKKARLVITRGRWTGAFLEHKRTAPDV